MGEGDWPKIDGEALYASEVNNFQTLFVNSTNPVMSVASVTQSNGSTTNASASFWHLLNSGSNNIYLNFGASATTSKFYLKPGEQIDLNLNQTQLNYICDSGLTSILSVQSGTSATVYNNFLSSLISVGDTNTTIYSDTTYYKEWFVGNEGTSDVYITFEATATTSKYLLKFGEYKIFYVYSNVLAGITSSDTANVRVFALG